MKKLLPILLAVFLTEGIFLPWQASAQAPQKMSYQAVIRNTGNILVTNQQIGMRISILQGSITGTAVYEEIYNPKPSTNASGLVTIEIGGGTPVSGTFSAINWSSGPYFIKTETDPSGGASYTITVTSQLLSVPYAMHSRSSEIMTGEITESQITDLQGYLTEEEDPLFSAWDKSTGIEISEGQITDLQEYLTQESDPVFVASPVSSITVADVSNWNTAFGWGGSALWSEAGTNIYYNSGRVGIGTSSPATLIHVHGVPVTSRGQLSLSAPSGEGSFLSFYEANEFKAYLWYDVSDDDLRLQNFTAGDLNLNPYGGKVGIGTNTPGYTLDVSGNINFTGTFTQNGSPFAIPWTNLTGTPTTLEGYSITDAVKNTLDIKFINQVQKGDMVITTGGLYGKITVVEENFVKIMVEEVLLKVHKKAIRKPSDY